MFNLFTKKKYLPLNEYPQSWSIFVEKPDSLLLRVNMGYKDAIAHPGYPIKMGIAIPVEEHDGVTMEIKGEIEDTLNDILLKTGDGALVAIITGMEGQKFIEFLSYTKRNGIDFAKIHQGLKDKFKDYEVQMYAEVDIEWEAYKSFAHL
jgi:hypothetical protein